MDKNVNVFYLEQRKNHSLIEYKDSISSRLPLRVFVGHYCPQNFSQSQKSKILRQAKKIDTKQFGLGRL